jgi:hypothetical protein
MGVALAIVIGLVVVGGLIYGAISTYGRQQSVLAERKAERERTGAEAERQAEHARREAAARAEDD